MPSKYGKIVAILLFLPFFAFGINPEIYHNTRTFDDSGVHAPGKKPIVLGNGRIRVSSVESYDVQKEGDDITSCSYIARNNLNMILSAMRISSESVARGDAEILIKKGRERNTLTPFSHKKSLLEALNERKNHYSETVFDVYRYVADRPPEIQNHRAIVFLGDDEQWYILDPIDGDETLKPQNFHRYIDSDTDDAQWFIQLPGYGLTNLISYDVFLSALPIISPELYDFFQQQYFQIPWKLRQLEFSRRDVRARASL